MVTLQQVKDYLWITNNTSDTRLQAILDATLGSMYNLIGDYSYGEKTIKVRNKNLKDKIGLLHINMDTSEPLSIDGNVVAEYNLLDNWEVEIKDIYTYITSDYSTSEIVYTAWYTETPSKIVWLVAEKVGFDFAKELWQVVSSEQMWPRSVEFFWDGKSSDMSKQSFINGLKYYIPLHLRIW